MNFNEINKKRVNKSYVPIKRVNKLYVPIKHIAFS